MPTRNNKALADALAQFLSQHNAITCLSCVNLINGVCQLVGQTPPPEVIVKGCEAYIDTEELPF